MPVPVKRKRAFAPKTRTGCMTCRARRIKCDEEKPLCKNCSSTGRSCEGYGGGNKLETITHSKRALLPAHSLSEDIKSLTLATGCAFVSSLNEIEIQAFDFFRLQTSSQLQSCLPSAGWIRLALQLSHCEPALLHAVAAVGAMHRARASIAHTSLTVVTDPERHRVALNRYCKAINHLQSYISDVNGNEISASIEVILTACLLFVMFEMIQGEDALAMAHFYRGLKIMREYISRNAARKASSGTNASLVNISPKTELDNLLATFLELENHSAMFGGHTPFLNLAQEIDSLKTDITIPDAFSTVPEAKAYLDVLANAALRVRGELINLGHPLVSTHTNQKLDWTQAQCVARSLGRQVDLTPHQHLLRRWKAVEKALDAWLIALRELRKVADRETTYAITLLEIQQFYTYYFVATARTTREVDNDRFHDDFARIIELTESLMSDRNGNTLKYRQHKILQAKRASVMEPCVLPTLYLVAVRCRSSTIRRRAIELLASQKEDAPGIGIFYAFVRRVIHLEEKRARQSNPALDLTGRELLDYEDIPEQARFVDVALTGVSDRPGLGRLVCVRFAHERNGEIDVCDEYFERPKPASTP